MTERRPVRRRVAGAVAAAAVMALAVPALAQAPLPPSVGVDTRFAPPDGIARDDFGSSSPTDIPSGVAVDGDRIYTVGETGGNTADIAIVARKTDGSFDAAFSGDGKLTVPLAADTGKDVGVSIVVLPDHRLRVLASTDVTAGSGTNIDVAIVGLNPDGSFDTSFGAGTGVVRFPVGQNNDTPTRLAVGPDGRLAVSGARNDGSKEDAFVSLREPDGAPVAGFGTNGVRIFANPNAALNDRAVDVTFRPGGGIVALVQNETNPETTINDYQAVLRAFDDAGNDDPRFSEDGSLVLEVGQPDTVPGSVMAYADRLWVVGATKQGQDTNAFLARLDAAGGGLESRQYDMRGTALDKDTLVTSSGSDMAVVPGINPTLVVTGSINYSSRPYWAAAAFNNLGAPLAQLGFGDVLIPTDEYGAMVGVAAGGDGWVGVAGSLVDTSENFDTSFGTARLLIDADKRCDLSIDVPRPLEIGLTETHVARVTIKVTNVGTKACGGTVSVPDAYALDRDGVTGPITVDAIGPGSSTTIDADLRYVGGTRLREDLIGFSVHAESDVVVQNDVKRVRVVFDFCDLTLRRIGRSELLLPSEGGRRAEYSTRNVGTIECEKVHVGAGGDGTLVRGDGRFDLRPGRSASAFPRLGAADGAKPGDTGQIVVRVLGESVANDVDDEVGAPFRVASVGDSSIRRAGRSGVAGRARGAKRDLSRRQRRVKRVQVAISRKAGKRCRWVTRSGKLRKRSCSRPVWLKARGKRGWHLRLRRSLSPGRYTARSRAVIGAGFAEAEFSRRDRNLRSFTVR